MVKRGACKILALHQASLPCMYKIIHEYLDINLYEEHGKGHWKICVSLESNMAISHLKIIEGQNSLAKKFVTVVENPKPGGI